MPSPLTTGQALLDPPRIDALLDDIDGGDSNLLPREAWLVPLRIEFPMWNNSAPAPGYPERLVLLWNGSAIGERTWTAPVQPEELFLKVEPLWLTEGRHTLEYQVTIYNSETAASQPLTITIDKTAPVLGDDFGRLLFADRVLGQVFGHAGLLIMGSTAALVIAYVIRFVAIPAGSIEAGLTRIPPSLEQASRLLGETSGGTLRRVHLPLLKPALAASALLVFVDTMKELPATLLLRPLNFDTLATWLYAEAARGTYEEGAVAALAIVAAGLLPVILLARTHLKMES